MNIALICEGVSEVKVLKYIVERFFGDIDVSVNAFQPTLDNNDKQDCYGGWSEVLSHCNDENVKTALATNDYLIIQIDTDTSHLPGYEAISEEEKRNHISDDILYDKVLTRLLKKVTPGLYNTVKDKIIFAICIEEIECWLLPLCYENNPNKRCATNNCVYKLNEAIPKEIGHIPDTQKNSNEAKNAYNYVLKKMKHKDVPRIAQYNYGFKKFIEQLENIKSSLQLDASADEAGESPT